MNDQMIKTIITIAVLAFPVALCNAQGTTPSDAAAETPQALKRSIEDLNLVGAPVVLSLPSSVR